MRVTLAVAVALLGTPLCVSAQILPLKKGTKALVAIPMEALDTVPERPYRRDVNARESAVGAHLSWEAGTVAVGGDTAWRQAGWPTLAVMKTEAVKRRKDEGETIVRLSRRGWRDVVLIMPTADEERIWNSVVADSAEIETVKAGAMAAIRPLLFTGDLESVSRSSQDELLEWLMLGGGSFELLEFKADRYFSVDLGELGVVYNELKLTESARVAEVVNERLLDLLKAFAGVGQEVSTFGLAVSVGIPHRSFASSSSRYDVDKLQLFVAVKDVLSFASADITSQQLVDAATVLVNGNRVAVDLSLR